MFRSLNNRLLLFLFLLLLLLLVAVVVVVGIALRSCPEAIMEPGQSQSRVIPTKAACGLRLVVQRYRKAELLIDEKEYVSVGEQDEHIGVLVYVSFAKTATVEMVDKAALTILNLPIHTEGQWGDGQSSTKSILALQQQQQQQSTASLSTTCPKAPPTLSILLVPQANLIAKITRNGKSVQYREQSTKQRGEDLYHRLVTSVRTTLLAHEEAHQHHVTTSSKKNKPEAHHQHTKNNKLTDASIPPTELFRYRQQQQQQQAADSPHPTTTHIMYGTFDDSTGWPLTTAEGEPLSKSAQKKIQKQYKAHAQRHEKYQRKQQQQQDDNMNTVEPRTTDTSAPAAIAAAAAVRRRTSVANNNNNNEEELTTARTTQQHEEDDQHRQKEHPNPLKRPSYVQLLAGSFGKRQGLKFDSDMGPFCHVMEL